MTEFPRLRLTAGLLALSLTLGACGMNGPDDPSPEAAAPPSSAAQAEPSPTRSPSARSSSPTAAPSSSASSTAASSVASSSATPESASSSASRSTPESAVSSAPSEEEDAAAEGDATSAADEPATGASAPEEADGADGGDTESVAEPVTVDEPLVAPTEDLGGPQAGVAPGDAPVEIASPAPAPEVKKVPIEAVRPATPAPVATPEPAAAPSAAPTTKPSSAARPSAPAATRAPSSAPVAAPSTPHHAEPVPQVDVNCRVTRCIALTFDDGPGHHTGRLLDILAAEDVPATFYVLGQSASVNPALISRMGAEGHQVGNHSWGHPNLTTLSTAQVREQIQRTDAAIRAAGVVPSTVRAPYGALNESVLGALGGLSRAGSVTWSVDTRDWEHRTPSMTLASVKAQARAGGIVLMHDIHSTTVDAVPAVIHWLRAQGYTFVTVDTITGGVPSGTTVGRGMHP